MSANNEILIKKKGKKFIITHEDVDCGTMGIIGKTNTLKEAVKKANDFEKKINDDGNVIECGIRINI